MLKNKIIVIPSTEEQALPCFHIQADLKAPFRKYLAASGVQETRDPICLGPVGPGGEELVEIEVKDTSEAHMELIAGAFLAEQK